MAISKNKLLEGVSGTIGKILTIRQYPNKVVLGQKQKKPTGPRTAQQRDRESLFEEAQRLAVFYLSYPIIRIVYQLLAGPEKRAYNRLVSDLMLNNLKLPY